MALKKSNDGARRSRCVDARRLSGRPLLVWVWAILAMTVPAFAQEQARLPNSDKGYWQWIIALVVAALVFVPAFLNPKRSHQM